MKDDSDEFNEPYLPARYKEIIRKKKQRRLLNKDRDDRPCGCRCCRGVHPPQRVFHRIPTTGTLTHAVPHTICNSPADHRL